MSGSTRRNPLMPWIIGLVIILAALAFVGCQVASAGCGGASPVAGVMALLVMPAVYLGLIHVTLKNQG